MKDFLAKYGIAEEPTSWAVRRFCSPYFADEGAAASFRDRNRLAFDVRVRLATPFRGTVERPFLPQVSSGTDEKWEGDPPLGKWTEMECVVIGDFVDDAREVVRTHPRVMQARR